MLESTLIEKEKYKEERFYPDEGSSCLSVKAELKNGVKIYFLPHPNRPIKTEVRVKAWEFCSN